MLGFLWTILLFLRLAVALQLSLPDRATVNTRIPVNWKQEPGDPEKWDLRLTKDDVDQGLVLANMNTKGDSSGVKEVKIDRAGVFRLVAVFRAGPRESGFPQIGRSNTVRVVDGSPNGMAMNTLGPTNPLEAFPVTSVPATTSSFVPATPTAPGDRTTDTGTNTVDATQGAQAPSVNIPVMIGGILGGLVLLIGVTVLFVYLQRRRRRAKTRRQVIFHRELMVQRRPGPYVASASFSFDAETGSLHSDGSGRAYATPFAAGSPGR